MSKPIESKPIELGIGIVFGQANKQFNIGDMLHSAATQFEENPENSKDFKDFIAKKLDSFFVPNEIFTFKKFGDKTRPIQEKTYKISGATTDNLTVTLSGNASIVIELTVRDNLYKDTVIVLTNDTFVMYDPKHKGLLGEGSLGGRKRKTRNMRKKSRRTFRKRRTYKK